MHKCQLDRFSAKEAISGEKCAAMHLESKPRLAAGITCHNLTDSPEKKTSTAVTDGVCAEADIIVCACEHLFLHYMYLHDCS